MAETQISRKLQAAFRIEQRKPVSEPVLAEGLSLYLQGRYVDAFEAVRGAGPLQSWTGGDALAFGFRLANNTGAPRLASLLISRGHREDPTNEQVSVHYGYHLQRTKGNLPAWKHAIRAETIPGLSALCQADLVVMRAEIAGQYRDFETAWKLWHQARTLAPESVWIGVSKAAVLLCEERRDASLDALNEVLALRAWYRPAVQMKARVLHLLGRGEESRTFLAESLLHLQSSAVAIQLMNLKREVDDSEGMAELADKAQRMSVLEEPAERDWMQATRADIYCLNGNFAAAAAAAETVPGDYYQALAARLKAPDRKNGRVRLPFEFVHQKHNTCAPATLAALAHYWKSPITMEQITDAICYDGTYDYAGRSWCEANGFATQEFCVTADAAKALIQAGVPFMVSTVDIGSGHAQAVIGYDDLRETLFIQDPSEPHYREVPSADFFESHRLTGPRGLVMVPEKDKYRLEAMDLPESPIYELNYRFNLALAAYDRDAATNVLQQMDELTPAHRLPLLARLSLAVFDGNEVTRAECIEGLLEIFPGDARLLSWKTLSLRTLGRREDRIEVLSYAPVLRLMHPALLRELGTELMEDTRTWKKAGRCLWTAHAAMPGDAFLLLRIANWLQRSSAGQPDELLTFYRFAATVSDKVESNALIWVHYAVSQGRHEEALQWLRRRAQEYGSRSGGPAATLAQVLDVQGSLEAVDVMRKALELRPDDGELLLQMAGLESRLGDVMAAGALLERAKGKVYPGAWLRAKASWLRKQERLEAEQEVWYEVLEKEPLALDAHDALARELSGREDARAAADYFKKVCSQFPHHYGLGQRLAGWLRQIDAGEALAHLDKMLELHPEDPWACREKALVLHEMLNLPAALEFALRAADAAPEQAVNHVILGFIQDVAGQESSALDSYHRSIRLDVNYPPAFNGLFRIVQETSRKRMELGFIRKEMIRQVLNGSGLHSYRQHAFAILRTEELLEELRDIWQARPDLWEAWSVYVAQLLDSGERFVSEAVALATEATVRFPLYPGAWADLATVQRLQGNHGAAVQTMEKVVQINPDWSPGWKLLAEFQADDSHAREAVATLRCGLRRLPQDSSLRTSLAALLWNVNEREEAWDFAKKVVLTNPEETWAWGNLKGWASVLGRGPELVEIARNLVVQCPKVARYWFVLAEMLPLENIAEILDALARAIELNPKLVEAYDFRAEMLGRLGRLDEAEKSLLGAPFFSNADSTPGVLRGRLAWLKALRGNVPGAMADMKAVVESHRDYFWGWESIAGWAEHTKNIREWRRAAAEMIRLSPRSALPYCAAAEAEFHTRQNKEGVQYLKQALHVEPAHPQAVQRLLHFHWECGDVKEVKAVARILPDDGTAGMIKKVYVLLAATRDGHEPTIRSLLNDLVVHPEMMGPLLPLIYSTFVQGGLRFGHLLDEALEKACQEESMGPSFALLWVRRECEGRQRWHCWMQLARWLPRLQARLDPAIGAYLDLIGEAGAANPHVLHFVEKCGSELRVRGEIWGKIGYALASSQAFRACVDWLSPDYSRPDAEGWMLCNLALSYRRVGNAEKAGVVSLHVVEQGMRDQTWLNHVGIASLGLANAGAFDQCKTLLSRESLEEADFEPRLHGLIARALCDVMSRPPPEGRYWFKQFLLATKPLVTQGGLSQQLKTDYDSAVEKMRVYTGAILLPWQKVKTQTYQRPKESSGIPKVAMWFCALFLLQSLRLCRDTSPPPASIPIVPVPQHYRSPASEMDKALEPFRRTSPSAPDLIFTPPSSPEPGRPPPVLLQEELRLDFNTSPLKPTLKLD